MNIRAGKRIIPGMGFAALLPTNDPDTLRKLALSLLEESHKKDHQIHLLKDALMLARQQRFGRQAESFSSLQRSLFEEDADADIASAETQLARLLPEAEEKKARPARKPRSPCRNGAEDDPRVIQSGEKDPPQIAGKTPAVATAVCETATGCAVVVADGAGTTVRAGFGAA